MTLLKRILRPGPPVCESCRHWRREPRFASPLGACALRKSKVAAAYTQAKDSCSLHQTNRQTPESAPETAL